MTRFIGREQELKRLQLLLKKKTASFVVIRGRRRIGKSRLIEEFGRTLPCHLLTGLPPTTGLNKQTQLNEFCDQVSESFDIPQFQVRNWGEAFRHLSKLCSRGRVVLALDEISWMGSKDSRFLPQLKNAWDRYFSKNPELILIVAGSVSSWIEANILSSTGFVGRISLDIQLKELPLKDAIRFWDGCAERIGSYEVLKILSVTGGVPRYLEEVMPQLTAEENIRCLCFDRMGLLYKEFDQIFSDLFSAKAPVYGSILEFLAQRPRLFTDITAHFKDRRSATISDYLQDLVQAGFLTEDPTWNLSTMKMSNLKNYRLVDNYLRFYLRYVKPQKESIAQGRFQYTSLSSLPGWDAVIGLQFENLVLNNVPALFPLLGLTPTDVLRFGPFFQRKTTRTRGCQIDLLIQARYRSLFICEIKFSPEKIGIEAAHQVREKIGRIAMPKGWSTRSVLIHVNGYTRELQQSDTFDHIIDFSELLHS